MDSQQLLQHPGHIIIGTQQEASTMVKELLRQLLCKKHGCNSCINCSAVDAQQHSACLWLNPEKQYTLDDLESVRERIRFVLEDNEHFFFILNNAQTLSTACSNSLLKLLEEPPHGYHFIFITSHLEALLPTIRSRCLLQYVSKKSVNIEHPLLTPCITLAFPPATTWLRILEETEINELETMQLIDHAYAHWSAEYKKAIAKNSTKNIMRSERMIKILQAAHKQPPMPGSSKIFWKQLFLELHTL